MPYHLIDQHASHCMDKLSESDFGFDQVRKFGFENSESEPIKRNCKLTICQQNTSGSKILHLSPYKGAFLLRHFAHTKGKNLINRVTNNKTLLCDNERGT